MRALNLQPPTTSAWGHYPCHDNSAIPPHRAAAVRGDAGISPEASTSTHMGGVYRKPKMRPSSGEKFRMYVVQGGDTIDSIARLYRVDPAILAKDNGVATRAHLSAGSVLWAPGDKPPQIAAGQYPTTLTSVAAGLVVALSAWPSVVEWRREQERRRMEEEERAAEERRQRMLAQKARMRAALVSSRPEHVRSWSEDESSSSEAQEDEAEGQPLSEAGMQDMQKEYAKFLRGSKMDTRKLWNLDDLSASSPFKKVK